MSIDRTQGFFHSYANRFDALYSNHQGLINAITNRVFRRSMKLRFLKTIEGCQPIEGMSILDVGCGPGHYGINLAQCGASHVVGIDFAQNMLQIAAQHASESGVADSCEFRQADFLEFNPPDRFDYVILMGFMDYMKDPQCVIDKALTLARRKVFFSFPVEGGLLAWQRKVRYRKRCDIFMYSEDTLRALFQPLVGNDARIERIARDFFVTASVGVSHATASRNRSFGQRDQEVTMSCPQPLKSLGNQPGTRDFLGIPVHLISERETMSQLLGWRDLRRGSYITFVNPHSILLCSRDRRRMRSAITGSGLALPDGVGVTGAARLLGYGRANRVSGPSLMLNVCDLGRTHGLRHFLYGGGKAWPKRSAVASWIATQPSKLSVPCPPFSEITRPRTEEIVQRINSASPDLVWVALGTGKQEKWMASHVHRLGFSILLGVGAAFDFHAGTAPWAPAWVRRAGLEWAYRTAHEPSRLFRRNLDNLAFLGKIIAQRTIPNRKAHRSPI